MPSVDRSPHIALSYYLSVLDTDEIIDSNPPMTKLGSSGMVDCPPNLSLL